MPKTLGIINEVTSLIIKDKSMGLGEHEREILITYIEYLIEESKSITLDKADKSMLRKLESYLKKMNKYKISYERHESQMINTYALRAHL